MCRPTKRPTHGPNPNVCDFRWNLCASLRFPSGHRISLKVLSICSNRITHTIEYEAFSHEHREEKTSNNSAIKTVTERTSSKKKRKEKKNQLNKLKIMYGHFPMGNLSLIFQDVVCVFFFVSFVFRLVRTMYCWMGWMNAFRSSSSFVFSSFWWRSSSKSSSGKRQFICTYLICNLIFSARCVPRKESTKMKEKHTLTPKL